LKALWAICLIYHITVAATDNASQEVSASYKKVRKQIYKMGETKKLEVDIRKRIRKAMIKKICKVLPFLKW
jgi:hypothetical protein